MKKFLVLFAALAALWTAPAHAALQVDVTQGNAQPLPIAIPDDAVGVSEGVPLAPIVK